jgi:TPR repeat protein
MLREELSKMTPIDFDELPKDGKSLFNLAQEYIFNSRSREESEIATKLIIMAAQLDYPEAQFELASYYRKGSWVELDANLALHWCTKAANNGLIVAQRDLGITAYDGLAGECDFEEAVKWFSIADKLGDMESRYWLGIMHIEGKAFPRNASLGHGLISRAANRDCKKAQLELAFMFEYGTSVVSIDANKSAYWFFNAMDVFYGMHPKMQYQKSINDWWLPAAQRGYVEAQYQVGVEYEKLVRISDAERDTLAEYWYGCAAQQGHVLARLRLAEKRKTEYL